MRTILLVFSLFGLFCCTTEFSSGKPHLDPNRHEISTPQVPGITEHDWDILYRTVYGEVRNQSDAEIIGVINVIYNRWQSEEWGSSLSGVLQAPKQFSVWNKGDRSRKIITNKRRIIPSKMQRVRRLCNRVFHGRYFKNIRDTTGGALSFYHPRGMACKRYSVKRGKRTCRVRAKPEWHWDGQKVRIGQAIFVRN